MVDTAVSAIPSKGIAQSDKSGNPQIRNLQPQEGEFRVFVAGLKWNLTDQEFSESAHKFGPIESANIMKHASGKSRGVGFVNYNSKEEMMSALEKIEEAEQARYNQDANGSKIESTNLPISDQKPVPDGENNADASLVSLPEPAQEAAVAEADLEKQRMLEDSKIGDGQNIENDIQSRSNAARIGSPAADASSQIESQSFSLKSLGGGPLKLREKFQRNSTYPY